MRFIFIFCAVKVALGYKYTDIFIGLLNIMCDWVQLQMTADEIGSYNISRVIDYSFP